MILTGHLCKIKLPHWIRGGGALICISFINTSTSVEIWHKVNFKQSLTGLNSKFSFSPDWLPNQS